MGRTLLADQPPRNLLLPAPDDMIQDFVPTHGVRDGVHRHQLVDADEAGIADVAPDPARQQKRAGRGANRPERRRGALVRAALAGRLAHREAGVRHCDAEPAAADQPAHRHGLGDESARRIDEDRKSPAGERLDHLAQLLRCPGHDLAVCGDPCRAVRIAARTLCAHERNVHRLAGEQLSRSRQRWFRNGRRGSRGARGPGGSHGDIHMNDPVRRRGIVAERIRTLMGAGVIDDFPHAAAANAAAS